MDKDFIEERMNNPLIIKVCKTILESPFADSELKLRAKNYLNAKDAETAFEATRHLISAAVKYRMTNRQVIDYITIATKLGNFDESLSELYISRAKALHEQGIVYCQCPACNLCTKILELK